MSGGASQPTGQFSLFNDVHNFFRYMTAEVENTKRQALEKDASRRQERDELIAKLEQERLERRDEMNKLRYEFEEFVHHKVDEVLQEIHEFQFSEKGDDTAQQKQIELLKAHVNQFKDALIGVQVSWQKFAVTCPVDPSYAEKHPDKSG